MFRIDELHSRRSFTILRVALLCASASATLHAQSRIGWVSDGTHWAWTDASLAGVGDVDGTPDVAVGAPGVPATIHIHSGATGVELHAITGGPAGVNTSDGVQIGFVP